MTFLKHLAAGIAHEVHPADGCGFLKQLAEREFTATRDFTFTDR